ncbi:MAG: hypothetical protein SFW08_09990 [Gemmatimonadaceae bacterium]|nr:hypothetical protein [Gemmatimonadaceae bacterium]
MTVPHSLDGMWRFLLWGFTPRQQPILDAWLAVVSRWCSQERRVTAWELPVVDVASAWERTIVEHAMRSVIRAPEARARTISIYRPVRDVLRCLGMDRPEVTVLLVDTLGVIHFRAIGKPDQTAALAARSVLDKLLARVDARAH